MAGSQDNPGPLDYETPRPRVPRGTTWVARAEAAAQATRSPAARRIGRRVCAIWVAGLLMLHAALERLASDPSDTRNE